MRRAALSAVVVVTVSLLVSCGASPDEVEPSAIGAAPAAQSSGATTHDVPAEDDASAFVVLGAQDEIDVREEGEDVVMDGPIARLRHHRGRWSREVRPDPAPERASADAKDDEDGPVGPGFARVMTTRGDTRWTFGDLDDAPDDRRFGVEERARDGRRRLHSLSFRHGHYAVFPTKIVARAPDDVWVFASTTSDHFGPDFPGCPIIVLHSQDGGYVAHYDGRAWTEIDYPSKRHLDSVTIDGAGRFVVTSGWSPEMTPYGLPEIEQEEWTLDPSTRAWSRRPDAGPDRSALLGWKARGGRLLRHDGGGWEDVSSQLSSGSSSHVLRVVAVDERDAFVLVAPFASYASPVWIRTR